MEIRATPSPRKRTTPSTGLNDGARGPQRRHTEPSSLSESLELSRAVDRWLSDDRAQGWSQSTLNERRENFTRLAWGLEHQERVAPTRCACAAI